LGASYNRGQCYHFKNNCCLSIGKTLAFLLKNFTVYVKMNHNINIA
jgi:hypothetical protein